MVLTAIVEIGTAQTKIGIGGESAPRHIIPTRLVNSKLSGGELESGSNGTLSLSNVQFPLPSFHSMMENRTMTSSEGAVSQVSIEHHIAALSDLVHQIFFHYLLVNPGEVHVVLVEDMLWHPSFKTALTHLFTKRYPTKSLRFIPAAICATWATGQDTALVVDVGHAETRVVPVVAGYILESCQVLAPIGFQTVQAAVKDGMLKAYPSLQNEALSIRTWENMTAELVFHAPELEQKNVNLDDAEMQDCSVENYPLHEIKTRVRVDASIRTRSTDVLFGQGHDREFSLQGCVAQVLARCPIDHRLQLAQCVVTTGGVFQLMGVTQHLNTLCGKDTRFVELGIPPTIVAWQGASLIAEFVS